MEIAKPETTSLEANLNAVVTDDMTFSYPIFNQAHTSAIVHYIGGTTLWSKAGSLEGMRSGRLIHLMKRHGRWFIRRVKMEWVS